MLQMEPYLPLLHRLPLFSGIDEEQLRVLLGCLSTEVRRYAADSFLLYEGDPATRMGVLLEGQAQIVQDDYFGNRTILAVLEPGEAFAEAFVCAGAAQLPVGVQAVTPCVAALMDMKMGLELCAQKCSFHVVFVTNLMRVLAAKNLELNNKALLLSRRTTRDKVLAFLSDCSRRAGAAHFEIPFTRQQMADYLSVDRSALSAELSRMQKEGLLHYTKNSFSLEQSADA